MESEALVNKENVRAWLWSAIVWMTVFPILGIIVSIKFHNPDFLGGIPWLTWGRIRPLHVNGVIWGSFSTTFFAAVNYFVPKLCGVRLHKEEWSKKIVWIWNFGLVYSTVGLLAGGDGFWAGNKGIEAGDFPVVGDIFLFLAMGLLTVQVLGTMVRRTEKRFYVAMWYTVSAFIWTDMNFILGNFILPYKIAGVNSAAMHGLYLHYVVGLWITPAGLALIYYFLPVAAKNPLYSHKLSLIGFWSLAFFYPFVGIHHYLYSPIANWTQTIAIVTSMMLIIPVWTVVQNFFGTMKGKWVEMALGNWPAKWCILGALYYFLGCFQGSTEALRRIQQLTHFNDFVISHSHLTVFGTFVVWAVAAAYYIWPKVTGNKLWSDQLAAWHFWLTVTGFSLMAVVLTAMGFIQGSMLEYGANFVDTVVEMRPWWVVRTLAGITMDIGFVFMAYNFWMTQKAGEPLPKEAPAPKVKAPAPTADAAGGFLEQPGFVMLGAGVFCFFLALGVQGIIPLIDTSSRVNTVISVDGDKLQATAYTPAELHGRRVFIREGCWYCHSAFVRPVTGEERRWGPVSQVGEYAYDIPHLFGTRRIGPDLAREGRRYGDDWHIAHHYNPRAIVPDSIMPSFTWLFNGVDEKGTPKMTQEGLDLVAYIQKLGTNIGDWRESFASTNLKAGASAPTDAESVSFGKQVYQRRCIGCHGANGDGNGASAMFLDPKPRNFTTGIFKFHSTPGKDALPTDADLYITITHGLWGTAMPPWYEISERERLAVISYIKTFSNRWKTEKVDRPLVIPDETPVTPEGIARGRDIFMGKAACFTCHGSEGKGDGILATSGALKDAWGNTLHPANFTLPAGVKGGVKLGHDGEHIYTVIHNGVGATPMPVFGDAPSGKGVLEPGEIWDTVHYVQSLRAAAKTREVHALLAPTKDESVRVAHQR